MRTLLDDMIESGKHVPPNAAPSHAQQQTEARKLAKTRVLVINKKGSKFTSAQVTENSQHLKNGGVSIVRENQDETLPDFTYQDVNG